MRIKKKLKDFWYENIFQLNSIQWCRKFIECNTFIKKKKIKLIEKGMLIKMQLNYIDKKN